MKTLRVCNKSFNKKPGVMVLPQELLEEGLELVKRTEADAVKELIRYGHKVRGRALREVIASDKSWQKVIVGIVVNGPDAFPLEHIEWCAYSAPYEGFLTITLLVKDLNLPVSWRENAIRDAHYSAHKYEKAIYEICKNVDHCTIMRWLLSKNSPCWQIAGICACAANAGLDTTFYVKAAEAFNNLMRNQVRFKSYWLYRKFYDAECHEIHARDKAVENILQLCGDDITSVAIPG